MGICDPVVVCTDGCEETIGCACVIYKGPHLPVIDAMEGDTLCDILTRINDLFKSLIMIETDIPTYNYRARCLNSDSQQLTVVSLKKNGVEQVLATVLYPNGASALAWLQTVDAGWLYTSPNNFSIQSADTWALVISCPV